LVPYSVYRRIRIKKSGHFDLILKPQKSLKNCIDPLLKTSSYSPFGLNPSYIFLARLIPHLLIFSGLKPLPLNFLSLNKVTVPRDPFVKTFESGTSELIVPALCEILCVVSLCYSDGAVHTGTPHDSSYRGRAVVMDGAPLPK
jgi:hypothetical protein